MASYYYLISSLPMLRTQGEPPMDYAAFLAMCRSAVSAGVYRTLEELTVDSDKGPLLSEWAGFYKALCRELTKLHEEIWKTTLGEAVEHYRAAEPRGEYVLVMAGAPAGAAEEEELTLEQAAQRAFALTIEGFSASAAAKTAAQGTAYSKSEVYKQLLLLQQATE